MKIKKKKTTIVWRKNQNPVDCFAIWEIPFITYPFFFFFFKTYLFPCGSVVRDLPTMRETWVRSLAWEDPLGKGYPFQYSRESQHTRLPCPSPTTRVHSNSCASSQWCHPANSSSVVPFSSCPQSLPASGSFPMSQLLGWGGQSIGVSASTSVLPVNNPGLISFRMDWLDLLAIQGTFKTLLQHHNSKASVLQHSAFFTVQLLTLIHGSWENLSLD